MKKVDINVLIQLLGMVGIIGSLIFVGLEMRQSQRIALAAQQQSRTQVWTDLFNTFTEAGVSYDEITMKLNGERRGIFPDPDRLASLSETERVANDNWTYWYWQTAENDYLQYDLGLMDEDIWQAKLAGWAFVYNMCDSRHIFTFMEPFYNKKFTTIISSFTDECME